MCSGMTPAPGGGGTTRTLMKSGSGPLVHVGLATPTSLRGFFTGGTTTPRGFFPGIVAGGTTTFPGDQFGPFTRSPAAAQAMQLPTLFRPGGGLRPRNVNHVLGAPPPAGAEAVSARTSSASVATKTPPLGAPAEAAKNGALSAEELIIDGSEKCEESEKNREESLVGDSRPPLLPKAVLPPTKLLQPPGGFLTVPVPPPKQDQVLQKKRAMSNLDAISANTQSNFGGGRSRTPRVFAPGAGAGKVVPSFFVFPPTRFLSEGRLSSAPDHENDLLQEDGTEEPPQQFSTSLSPPLPPPPAPLQKVEHDEQPPPGRRSFMKRSSGYVAAGVMKAALAKMHEPPAARNPKTAAGVRGVDQHARSLNCPPGVNWFTPISFPPRGPFSAARPAKQFPSPSLLAISPIPAEDDTGRNDRPAPMEERRNDAEASSAEQVPKNGRASGTPMSHGRAPAAPKLPKMPGPQAPLLCPVPLMFGAKTFSKNARTSEPIMAPPRQPQQQGSVFAQWAAGPSGAGRGGGTTPKGLFGRNPTPNWLGKFSGTGGRCRSPPPTDAVGRQQEQEQSPRRDSSKGRRSPAGIADNEHNFVGVVVPRGNSGRRVASVGAVPRGMLMPPMLPMPLRCGKIFWNRRSLLYPHSGKTAGF